MVGAVEGTFKANPKVQISNDEVEFDGKVSYLRVVIKHLVNCGFMSEDKSCALADRQNCTSLLELAESQIN